MNGFGYEELAAAQQSVDFPDVNTANEWLSNNDIYINGCSFNTKRLFEAKKPLIVIRFKLDLLEKASIHIERNGSHTILIKCLFQCILIVSSLVRMEVLL